MRRLSKHRAAAAASSAKKAAADTDDGDDGTPRKGSFSLFTASALRAETWSRLTAKLEEVARAAANADFSGAFLKLFDKAMEKEVGEKKQAPATALSSKADADTTQPPAAAPTTPEKKAAITPTKPAAAADAAATPAFASPIIAVRKKLSEGQKLLMQHLNDLKSKADAVHADLKDKADAVHAAVGAADEARIEKKWTLEHLTEKMEELEQAAASAEIPLLGLFDRALTNLLRHAEGPKDEAPPAAEEAAAEAPAAEAPAAEAEPVAEAAEEEAPAPAPAPAPEAEAAPKVVLPMAVLTSPAAEAEAAEAEAEK